MSKPKITTLMEDTLCGTGLEAEHGLSLYIETEKHKLLADTGQTAKHGQMPVQKKSISQK